MILCDGCAGPVPGLQLSLISAKGVQVRYCVACRETWEALESACQAQAAVYNRLQDMFERDAREKTMLWITPLDFPKFWESEERGLKLG